MENFVPTNRLLTRRPLLKGRALRAAILLVFDESDVALSVADVEDSVRSMGFDLPERAGKRLSDALRRERNHGRVVRLGRNRYRRGAITRNQRHRARKRLDAIRFGEENGDGSDPGAQGGSRW